MQQQKQSPLVLSALREGVNTPGHTKTGVHLRLPSATLQVRLVQGGLSWAPDRENNHPLPRKSDTVHPSIMPGNTILPPHPQTHLI